MIVVRGVFQAKYGKGDELVQLLKEGEKIWPPVRNSRILTDVSGPFFTVVSEGEFDSLAAYEAYNRQTFDTARFAEWFERMVPLVEHGHREFYNLVE